MASEAGVVWSRRILVYETILFVLLLQNTRYDSYRFFSLVRCIIFIFYSACLPFFFLLEYVYALPLFGY